MVFIQSLVQYLLLGPLFLGPLWQRSIDILLVIYTLLIVFNNLPSKQPYPLHTKYFFIFIIYSWINLGINYLFYDYSPIVPALYLIRLTCLLLLFTFPLNLSPRFSQILTLTLITNLLFGLIQYLLWPDLTAFRTIGWDDHLNRLVSTYLDPTFTGLIYVLFFIFLFFKPKKNLVTNILLLVTYIAISFTYSRSTLLAFTISLGYYFIKTQKIKNIIMLFFIMTFTIFLLPRRPGEGTRLERTSSISAKVDNLLDGLTQLTRSPLTGIGYNNIVHIKDLTSDSHSRGGYDLSLLNILITNGVVGFIILTIGFSSLFRNSQLVLQTMFLAVFIHSLFANSLFYPYSTLLLAFFYQSKYHK